MKNFKYILFCLLFMPVLMLSGCQNRLYDLAKINLSEERINLFTYSDSDIKIKFETGYREKDYRIDGVHTENVPFGVVTFDILGDTKLESIPQYVILIGTTRIDGELEKNPFNDTFVADTGKYVSEDTNIVAKFVSGSYSVEKELTNVSSNMEVSGDKALKLACEHFSKELKSYIVSDKFEGEGYLRIVTDENVSDKYFWYVNFVMQDRVQFTCVIDSTTGEILADKGMLR